MVLDMFSKSRMTEGELVSAALQCAVGAGSAVQLTRDQPCSITLLSIFLLYLV